MARKRTKKRHWRRVLLLFLFVPLLIWGAAFLIWLNWYDLAGLPGKESGREKPAAGRGETARRGEARENHETLLEEDRRQLEEILKKK